MSKKVVIDFEVKYKEAAFDVEQLNKKVTELETEIKKTNKEATKTKENFDDISNVADKATGGAISGFKGVVSTLKGVTTSLRTVRGALIATGFGAIAVVVGSLVAAFTSTEEGANKLSKIMNQVGVVIGNVTDIAAAFGEGIMNMGNSISAALRGDFVGAFYALGDAFDEFTNKVSNFGEETKKELGTARQISDMLAEAAKMERELKVERAKADQDRARLLEQAVDKEKFTAQERILFLQQASKIEQDITNKEIELAQKKLDAKILQNSLSGSTAEDLTAEAELQATVISLETARLSKQKEVTSQVLALYAEEMAARKERDAEANSFAAQIEKDADERNKIAKDKKIKDEAEEKTRADQNMKDGLARLQYEANQKVAIAQFVADAEAAIRESNLNNAAAGFALLGQIAGENRALQAAALIGESAAGVAKTIVNTQTSNAATIAQGAALAIPTAGASVAAASALVASNNISAGIAIATNIAATAKGLSALKAGGSPKGGSISGGRGGTGASVSVPTSQVPSFNVVGASSNNQLAETIAGQNKQPLKAYVVASDVSTAQSLERNIVSSASI
jgi:hypothetical protein